MTPFEKKLIAKLGDPKEIWQFGRAAGLEALHVRTKFEVKTRPYRRNTSITSFFDGEKEVMLNPKVGEAIKTRYWVDTTRAENKREQQRRTAALKAFRAFSKRA